MRSRSRTEEPEAPTRKTEARRRVASFRTCRVPARSSQREDPETETKQLSRPHETLSRRPGARRFHRVCCNGLLCVNLRYRRSQPTGVENTRECSGLVLPRCGRLSTAGEPSRTPMARASRSATAVPSVGLQARLLRRRRKEETPAGVFLWWRADRGWSASSPVTHE